MKRASCRTRTAATAAAIILCLLLTSGAAIGVAPVELEYWIWDPNVETIVSDMANAFMAENPHISIELFSEPWATYWDKLAIVSSVGTPPDVFDMSVAYTWDYANEEMILNLQRYVDTLPRDEYFFTIMDSLRYPNRGGDLYAFPIGWTASLLFYNRSHFDEAGQPHPNNEWDWFQLRDVAKKLTRDVNGDGIPDVWGFFSSSTHEVLDPLIHSWGGSVLDETQTRSLLDQPKALEAIQFLVDLIHEDGVSPPPGRNPGFHTGGVAMYITQSGNVENFMRVADSLDWAAAMVPKGPNGRVVYGGPNNVSISTQSPNPDEAWEFIKYMTGPDRPANTYKRGWVPINRQAALNPDWLEWNGGARHNLHVLYETAEYVRGADFGTTQWSTWRSSVMNQALLPAFLGTESVYNAATNAVIQINAILGATECRLCQ